VGRLKVFASLAGMPPSSSTKVQQENLKEEKKRQGEAWRIIHITAASLKIDTNLSGKGKRFE
jgi:hypothetical protein